jgi:hypothetical protein
MFSVIFHKKVLLHTLKLKVHAAWLNPLTHDPQANQPCKFKMPYAQKVLKWD